MDLVIKDRGHGKTAWLVKKSAETGYRILTSHSSRYIQDIANELGLVIPQPLERRQLNLRQYQGFNELVLVDELDTFLEKALGYKIVAASLPSENTRVSKDSEHFRENEPNVDCMFINQKLEIGSGRYSQLLKKLSPTDFFSKHVSVDDIKDVIFNNPATIVYWKDGSKTVVKCQDGDTYSEELGLAMCIVKKLCGNNGNYNGVFKKWLPKESE